jgi:hypothetical protein
MLHVLRILKFVTEQYWVKTCVAELILQSEGTARIAARGRLSLVLCRFRNSAVTCRDSNLKWSLLRLPTL